MKLRLYEVEYNANLKDWLIAYSMEEAIELLKEFNPKITGDFSSIKDCKIIELDDSLQTMTPLGLLSVRKIIDFYQMPTYIKAS